jgi:uncharacterized repeat protein (TIGR01451 family)
MTRRGTIGWATEVPRRLARLYLGALAVAATGFPAAAVAQSPASPALSAPAPSSAPGITAPTPTSEPGHATTTEFSNSSSNTAIPQLPPEIQVVQFQAPEGVRIEILGPAPEPVAGTPGPGNLLVGLRVGVGYRLRLTNLPYRPGAELYPVLEIVGHLHRPADIDPARFPIRVIFQQLDIDDAVDHGRLVTQVIYLEDPEQALPFSVPKEEIPVVTLSPAEEPLRVGSALGRAMAIVRVGGRIPNPDEWSGSGVLDMASQPCPFSGPAGGRCPLPCGPARGTAPPAGHTWLPRDEYLCDGGDGAEVVHFGGDGALRGIDPRDAVIQFQADRRPRVLPTNIVCIYAPRFAAVRTSLGVNENLSVTVPRGADTAEKQVTEEAFQTPKRLAQNLSAEAFRHRARVSGLASRILPGQYTELRILQGYDTVIHVAGNILTQRDETYVGPLKAAAMREVNGPVTIKTAESAIVTGIIEGAGEMVMAWKPQELAGVELQPGRPGIQVIKRTSTGVAEPGDVVTYTILYRNMGNTPISSVSVIDSLLPRLEYVPGSALGPAGTVFTSRDNRAGSSDLRWDLPGTLSPGSGGYVSFKTKVR